MMVMYTDAEAAELLRQQQIINYVQVASAALWVYEWLILLQDEVSLVWSSRWSFMAYLYIWTRYSAVADTVLGLQSSLQRMSPAECRISDAVNSLLICIGIYTSELVLLWRTFAIWGDNKYVKYGLGSLWLAMIPLCLYFISSFIASTVYGPQPIPGLPGCNLVHASLIDIGAFICLLSIELIIVILTIVKGVQNARLMHHGRLMPVLTRDGVLFFICLLAISIACILVPLLGPHIYAVMLAPFLRVMHSVLCCRVILHIRNAAASMDIIDTSSGYPPCTTEVEFDTIEFRPPNGLCSIAIPMDELESGIVDSSNRSTRGSRHDRGFHWHGHGHGVRTPLQRDTSYYRAS